MESASIILDGSYATSVLWAVSGTLALLLALFLASGLESRHASVRALAEIVINFGRCVPTSLYVLAAGMLSLRLAPWLDGPALFVGTLPMFQPAALAVCLALAFGSAGHLAKILQSSWRTIPVETRDQFRILGLGVVESGRLAFCECALTALPPLSARLIHHLHNTAFAALFPVVDLFGRVQAAATSSARVVEFVTLGTTAYVILSFCIWLLFRVLEQTFSPRRPATERTPA